MNRNDLTRQITGAAIEVHKLLGPGLLESAYEECLCHELAIRGIHFENQKPIPFGLLINFNLSVLKDGVRRFIMPPQTKQAALNTEIAASSEKRPLTHHA